MGGTWDSTNVIDSDVAVLTNVDLDHTAVLGTTIGAIASDKVGIFRGERHRHRGDDERHRRRDRPAPRRRAGRDACGCSGTTSCSNATNWRWEGARSRVRTPFERYDDVLVSLHGIHQGVNAPRPSSPAEAFLGRALGRRS